METVSVECLRCGARHELVQNAGHTLEGSQCPRCGYLGWARPGELNDAVRVVMHERLVEYYTTTG